MYSVETHNNSKDYFKNLDIEKDALYITANTSISNMIIDNTNLSLSDKWRVMNIDNFINSLYPVWNNTLNNIRLKIVLRNIIFELKKSETFEDNIRVLNYLNDNISILCSDFIFLYQSGLKEFKSARSDLKLNIIRRIYDKFTKEEYFKKVSEEFSNPEQLNHISTNILKQYLKRLKNIDSEKATAVFNEVKKQNIKIRKIYFYNLNYIDLKRFMVIESLKFSGYDVKFRIPYFKGLTVINQCWEMVYGNKELFNININGDYSEAVKKDIKYIDFLEGVKSNNNISEKVCIKNYKEIYDFKKDISDDYFVTFYKGSIDAGLDRRNMNIKNHCYQTSVGRFIYNLYKCDVTEDDVIMDFNMFREMITSGWIEYKEWNGIRLKSFLVDNADYFSGVKSINEIIKRICGIKDTCEVASIFEDEAKSKIEKNKTKAFLSDPFRCLGYVNMDKYNITASYLLETSLKLKRSILKLYNDSDGFINVETHCNDLFALFNNKYIKTMYKEGTEFEKSVIKRIVFVLKNPNKIGKKVYKEDLEDILNVMLQVGEKHESTEKDFSIDQLEGVILRDQFFRKKNIIHLCDLSYKAYKKYTEKYETSSKILSDDDIKDIINDNLIGQNKVSALQGIKLQEISKKSYQSYVKFAIANLFINFNGEIEFSWIRELRKDDTESIILKQLESIYKNTEDVFEGLKPEDIEIDEIDKDFHQYNKKVLYSCEKNLPEVAFKDLDFCGDKFLYSSIIQDYPVYYSDFHQKLVFAQLISLLKDGIENSYFNIKKYIFPLFVQWQDVEKNNILDCEYVSKNLNEYKYFDGINYPKGIDKLYLLKSRYIIGEKSRIRNRYSEYEFNPKKYFDEFIDDYIKDEENNAGRHCRMCPHCFVCRKGDFVIDSI